MTTPETYLKLTRQPSGDVIEFPANSGTYIDCDLSPISSATQLARDVNGNLVNLGNDRFRKYALSLSCSGGVQLPALYNIWPGMTFSVELPVVLKEHGSTPSRDAVEGTVEQIGGYVQYRPVMSVMLTRNSLQETEWRGRSSGWSLSFEEIDAVFHDVPDLPDDLVEATGGIVSEHATQDGKRWRLHVFTGTSMLSVQKPGPAEVLVIAGAGGGAWGYTSSNGSYMGGSGAGAGGLVFADITLQAEDYRVEIGAGGAPGRGYNASTLSGRPGTDSLFSFIRAVGGGAGLSYEPRDARYGSGGSGGGQGYDDQTGYLYPLPGKAFDFQGHSGGAAFAVAEGNLSGGGGGYAGVGGAATPEKCGDAGPGVDVSGFLFGEAPDFRACGSAGALNLAESKAGETAPGGSAPGESGVANSGNGGGANGGAGASGFVAVRYRIA